MWEADGQPGQELCDDASSHLASAARARWVQLSDGPREAGNGVLSEVTCSEQQAGLYKTQHSRLVLHSTNIYYVCQALGIQDGEDEVCSR